MAAEKATFFDGPNGRADRERLFVVEGIDDACFVDALLTEHAADPAKVGVVYTEGKDRLRANLGSLVRSSAFVRGAIRHYAIVADADSDPATETARIHTILRELGQPEASHGSLSAGTPGVGLFLLPSDHEAGCLERLLLGTMPDDKRFQYVRDFFRDVQVSFEALDEPDKRLSRIYLDCCPGHSRGAGRAFRDGKFDHAHSALAPFKRFIEAVTA